MKRQKFLRLTVLLWTVSLGLTIASSSVTEVVAQTQSPKQFQTPDSKAIASVTFDPPNDGKPDDTSEGASRGDGCPQEAIALDSCVTPLVPVTKSRLTVAERPTFLIYVPQTSDREIFFALLNENNATHYQVKIPINANSGILSFKLPDSVPPLEIGKNYRWTFIIVGEGGLKPDSVGVRGEIVRVELTSALMSQLQNKTALEQAALYGRNGIWYDMIASLASAKRADPGNAIVVSTWQEMLISAGLETVATKPLLN